MRILLASALVALCAASAAAGERPAFRAGNAAQPLGWATAVADFNTDGQPDFAIADRIGRTHAFRLEFAISGEPPDHVTFESVEDALTVRVADVDRDNDLDLVVGTPFSNDTVAIWLNDGHGHFSAGALPGRRGAVEPLSTIDAAGNAAPIDAFDASPRRSDEAVTTAVRPAPPCARQQSAIQRSSRARSALPSPRSSPRAPPL